MSETKCEVEGNVLTAGGDFSSDAATGFDRACQELLSAPGRSHLIADLSGVERVSSTYVGLLAELGLGARKAGRPLVIRARPALAALFREAGLHQAATIEETRP